MLESVEKPHNPEHETIKNKLIEIIGKDWVSDFQEDLILYSYDMTENPPGMPEFIALPQTTEEISKIVKLANEYKIAVVPYSTGVNVGGLAIPLRGGIIVDFKRMDKILHINEANMYMIIEPGVTFGHVKKLLEEKYPNFRYCYPMAPPWASVTANALQDGLTNLSTRHGCMTEFINGIEAVLPNGDVVRIGTCMVRDGNFDSWWARVPMPDLMGLFLGWQGMTGIVTKISLTLWPKRPIRDQQFILVNDLEDAYNFVRYISHTEILNDLLLISTETIKLIQGVPYGEAKYLEGEPRYAVFCDFSANTKLEHKAKFEIIKEYVDSILKKKDPKVTLSSLDTIGKAMGGVVKQVSDMPFTIGGMLEYGGLTWIGTYFPTEVDNVVKGANEAFEVIKKHGFETCLYCRSMNSHHYWAFRFLLRFDKSKDGEIERVREMNKELYGSLLKYGAIPYKTPLWAAKLILEQSDPNTVKLFKKIKKTMDPNFIMNPGRWSLEEE
ncbi:MAG: FAD-binding oxidoreductase [Candidatus Helarchaeota archaeon]